MLCEADKTIMGFEEIEHTADWAIRIQGRDLGELLINAARAMSHLLVGNLGTLSHDVDKHLVIEGDDPESLLVTWLNELAYWAETEGIVFYAFDVQYVTPTQMQVTVQGGLAPELQKHIKAVTYHNLAIVKTNEGMEVTVVFDV